MIEIPKAVYDTMIQHAKEKYPQEACGLLAGKDGKVIRFMSMENTEHSSVSYAMDPKEQIRVFRDMDQEGQNLLAIFHSHVASSAEPSRTDREMAFYPDVSYLIVSLSNMEKPDLKSYKIHDDQVEAEEIIVQ